MIELKSSKTKNAQSVELKQISEIHLVVQTVVQEHVFDIDFFDYPENATNAFIEYLSRCKQMNTSPMVQICKIDEKHIDTRLVL